MEGRDLILCCKHLADLTSAAAYLLAAALRCIVQRSAGFAYCVRRF